MCNREGRQSTSTLVVCPKRNPPKNARITDGYVAFITNIRVDNPRDLLVHIPKTYRKRWGRDRIPRPRVGQGQDQEP